MSDVDLPDSIRCVKCGRTKVIDSFIENKNLEALCFECRDPAKQEQLRLHQKLRDYLAKDPHQRWLQTIRYPPPPKPKTMVELRVLAKEHELDTRGCRTKVQLQAMLIDNGIKT